MNKLVFILKLIIKDIILYNQNNQTFNQILICIVMFFLLNRYLNDLYFVEFQLNYI